MAHFRQMHAVLRNLIEAAAVCRTEAAKKKAGLQLSRTFFAPGASQRATAHVEHGNTLSDAAYPGSDDHIYS